MKKTIQNKNVAFGLFVVLFLVFWNLLEFLWSLLVTRTPYRFTVGTDLGIPLTLSLVLGYLHFLRK